MTIERITERITESELVAAERAVWEALRAGDQDADRALLTADFLGVYPSGFVGREDHVAELAAGPTVLDYELLEVRTMAVAPGSGLIAYRVRFRPVDPAARGADNNNIDDTDIDDTSAVEWMVSSLWRREPDGSLVNSFSQDTPVST